MNSYETSNKTLPEILAQDIPEPDSYHVTDGKYHPISIWLAINELKGKIERIPIDIDNNEK